MKRSYSKNRKCRCDWSLGFMQANNANAGKMTKSRPCYKCKCRKMCTFGVCKLQMLLKWQSAWEAVNANKWKCQIMIAVNVNATHPAWYYNIGQIEHKLVMYLGLAWPYRP